VKLDLFDYDLPPELIAQLPLSDRSSSRLLVLPRREGAIEHRTFSELPELLRPGDLLVLNETAVFPARLLGKRARTGGKVEVLLLSERSPGLWEALVRSKSAPAPGERIELGGTDVVIFDSPLGEGRALVRFEGSAFEVAERRGHVPLPPYIRGAEDTPDDRARYQTVYAREPGAVAAPTAGLHFTPDLLARVAARGVEVARLVLHVGLGTFQPVRAETLEEHRMHAERYAIPAATLEALERARAGKRRVVACGTTTVRALESFGATGRSSGETSLFITPGHEFRFVDALITNFHLPKSTLLVLVSAFAGRERVLAAYAEAVARRYRFYSYGDAMFIG